MFEEDDGIVRMVPVKDIEGFGMPLQKDPPTMKVTPKEGGSNTKEPTQPEKTQQTKDKGK